MYIETTQVYYVGTEQHCRKALFLLLIQPSSERWKTEPIKALVRKVALGQFGQWMMGKVNIYGQHLVVSGSYGNDGLPMSVPDEIYDRAAVVLPQELLELWNHGGGWNSAGSEAAAMREWAIDNLKELKK